MRRREFLMAPVLTPGAGPHEPHFPNALHQFVWRNWELANIERMAEVAACEPRRLLETGRAMGLPAKPRLTETELRRIYITLIRQNWALLPNEQITQLLGWTPEKFEFTLREDDFLDVKLGRKPECTRLRYGAPDAAARRRAAEIRATVRETFGRDWERPGERPFAFIERLSAPVPPTPPPAGEAVWDLRYVYSHFALYGDPLLEPEIDPFPDGYLARLRDAGINGVWLQGVLRTLAPSKRFPEFGAGWEKRLATLRGLAARAGRQGMRVFLYLNEPRAMPAEFFRGREGMKGAEVNGVYAMCTSASEVREWLRESVTHVFRQAPELGGVFTITMSENLTNCHSKLRPASCPRCSKRQDWEVVGEVLASIHAGVREASASAEVIAWDWGWPSAMARELIPRLDRDTRLQSVSEWSLPVERGGVKAEVGEYSISAVGPGPRALEHWGWARAAGLRTQAKTAFNNTWEISAVPYIPAGYLVARHCEGLRKAGVSGVQASWTLGGYPSPNLEIAREFYYGAAPDVETAVLRVAERRCGAVGGARAAKAWRIFSEAFEEFPYGVGIYTIPVQHGPANLLRAQATGVRGSMILFPQDDYKQWSGRYPPQVVRDQFAKMARMWAPGLDELRAAAALTPAARRAGAEEDLAVAEACWIHFRSTANQVEFYLQRDAGGGRARMRAIAADEIALARRLFTLARRHSELAYEASNHYYYRPLDLAEKVLNCREVLQRLR
jgi:hypothetical protein